MAKVSKKLVLNRNTVVNLSFKSGLKTGASTVPTVQCPYVTRGGGLSACLPTEPSPDQPVLVPVKGGSAALSS